MKYLILFSVISFFSAYSVGINAGTWTRINQETIKFEGNIEENEFERFSEVFSEETREIIVNSGGGSTYEGIKIAGSILKNPVKITVVGKCLSSCANYLFVAGKQREIRKGIVGFHGNVKACFSGENEKKNLEEIRAHLFKLNPNATDAEISEVLDNYLLETKEEIKAEEKILEIAGISQSLFDLTCALDKGMGNGEKYAFLLPTPETFKVFGFNNVEGTQDINIANEFGLPLLLH